MTKKVDYRKFRLAKSSRVCEDIEWNINYAFNSLDRKNPRVLLVGDSICNACYPAVRSRLADKVNVSFWASSKCVTDPTYLRMLDLMLDSMPYSIITFNNTLHSLTTDRGEWTEAYRNTVRFIKAKCPESKLSIVLGTPLRVAELTAVSRALNKIALKIAKEEGVPVVDLFTPMNKLDRIEFWADDYHFKQPAIDMQGDILKEHILNRLGLNGAAGKLRQKSTKTGPSGALK